MTPAVVAVPVAMKVRVCQSRVFVLDKLGGIRRPVDGGQIGAWMRRGDLDEAAPGPCAPEICRRTWTVWSSSQPPAADHFGDCRVLSRISSEPRMVERYLPTVISRPRGR